MRKATVASLISVVVLVAGFAIYTHVRATPVEFRFVKIARPADSQGYVTNANVTCMGYLLLRDKDRKPDDVLIRARIYRPVAGDFELVHEQTEAVKQGFRGQRGTFQFAMNLEHPKPADPGRYLLRVDCLESGKQRGEEQPQPLATDSVFLSFVTPEDAKRQVRVVPRD